MTTFPPALSLLQSVRLGLVTAAIALLAMVYRAGS